MQRTVFLSTLALIVTSFFYVQAEEQNLSIDKVLAAFPEAATMKSSLSVLHVAKEQAYQKIDGITYELRFVRYVDPHGQAVDKSLLQLIEEDNLGSEKLKVAPASHSPVEIYTFTQPEAWKAKGILVVISVRPLGDEEAPYTWGR